MIDGTRGFRDAAGNKTAHPAREIGLPLCPSTRGIRVLYIAREVIRLPGLRQDLGCRRRGTINFRGGPPGDNEDLETATEGGMRAERGGGHARGRLFALNPG